MAFGFGPWKQRKKVGGTPAPTPYDIIILAGQSNMAGRGTPRSGVLDIDDAKVDQFGAYASGSLYQIIGNDITPLQHPEALVNTNNHVGIGEYLGRTYAANNPTRKVLLVPVAVGGTALASGAAPWASGNPGGTLYEQAISQANLAVTAAVAAAPGSAVVGIAWIQGETDGDAVVSQPTYLAALNSLIAGFRARITGATNAWFLIGSMVPEAILTNGGYPAIDEAHMRATLAGTGIIFERGPRGFSDDNLHYNIGGVRAFGPALANAVPRAVKAEVKIDFECDAVGSVAPIGTGSNNGGAANTPLIVNVSGSKRLTSSGSGAIAANTIFGVYFRCTAGTMTDCVIEWDETYTTPGRAGMTMRAQGFTPNNSVGRDGYLFQPTSALDQYRIGKVVGGVFTQLAISSALAQFSGRRHRMSCIGTTVKWEYSDDGGANWTTACTVTDSTYAAGQTSYVQGFGNATAGTMFIDNISIRKAI